MVQLRVSIIFIGSHIEKIWVPYDAIMLKHEFHRMSPWKSMKKISWLHIVSLKSLTGHTTLWLTDVPYYEHGKKHETNGITKDFYVVSFACLGNPGCLFSQILKGKGWRQKPAPKKKCPVGKSCEFMLSCDCSRKKSVIENWQSHSWFSWILSGTNQQFLKKIAWKQRVISSILEWVSACNLIKFSMIS